MHKLRLLSYEFMSMYREHQEQICRDLVTALESPRTLDPSSPEYAKREEMVHRVWQKLTDMLQDEGSQENDEDNGDGDGEEEGNENEGDEDEDEAGDGGDDDEEDM